MTPATAEPILRLQDLEVRFPAGNGRELRAADGVSLEIAPGRVLGLVGESGCGKTVTGLSIARLLPPEPACRLAGCILFRGRDLMQASARELTAIRGKDITYVFQEPQVSFNPVMTVGSQIAEAVRLHLPGEKDVRGRVVGALREVGIADPERRANAYPHEMSGGMLQRAMIAMAIVCRPALVIADEPTTALDVTVQAQILDLLGAVCRDHALSLLLISHDLGVIHALAHRVCVMYAGQVVEEASRDELFEQPLHPYTQGLLESIPAPGLRARRLSAIPGRVTPIFDEPGRCRFSDRCSKAFDRCRTTIPPVFRRPADRTVRCLLYEERA